MRNFITFFFIFVSEREGTRGLTVIFEYRVFPHNINTWLSMVTVALEF